MQCQCEMWPLGHSTTAVSVRKGGVPSRNKKKHWHHSARCPIGELTDFTCVMFETRWFQQVEVGNIRTIYAAVRVECDPSVILVVAVSVTDRRHSIEKWPSKRGHQTTTAVQIVRQWLLTTSYLLLGDRLKAPGDVLTSNAYCRSDERRQNFHQIRYITVYSSPAL